MTFDQFIFYFFSAILLFAGLRVITARNPVHAAHYLVLAFFTAAGLWMTLEAEFLAITLVLVYVGAVMVLFLFVVMMLDINLDKLREGFWDYLPIAGFVSVLLMIEMALILGSRHFGLDVMATPEPHRRLAHEDEDRPAYAAACMGMGALLYSRADLHRLDKEFLDITDAELETFECATRVRYLGLLGLVRVAAGDLDSGKQGMDVERGLVAFHLIAKTLQESLGGLLEEQASGRPTGPGAPGGDIARIIGLGMHASWARQRKWGGILLIGKEKS